jgi:hypothetical protein
VTPASSNSLSRALPHAPSQTEIIMPKNHSMKLYSPMPTIGDPIAASKFPLTELLSRLLITIPGCQTVFTSLRYTILIHIYGILLPTLPCSTSTLEPSPSSPPSLRITSQVCTTTCVLNSVEWFPCTRSCARSQGLVASTTVSFVSSGYLGF